MCHIEEKHHIEGSAKLFRVERETALGLLVEHSFSCSKSFISNKVSKVDNSLIRPHDLR